jgi:hypothetical protein
VFHVGTLAMVETMHDEGHKAIIHYETKKANYTVVGFEFRLYPVSVNRLRRDTL